MSKITVRFNPFAMLDVALAAVNIVMYYANRASDIAIMNAITAGFCLGIAFCLTFDFGD